MSKNTNIQLALPQNEEEYNQLLRKFRLDALLTQISKEAVALFANVNEDGLRGYKWDKIDLYDKRTGRTIKQDVLVTAWGLVDLAYEAVLATNDYRGKETVTDTELYFLAFISATFQNKRYGETNTKSLKNHNPDFFLYLGGFSGEQFKMQTPEKVLESAVRDLYILLDVSKNAEYNTDMEKCIEAGIGTNWRNVLISLFLLWVISISAIDVKVLETSVCWDDDFSLNDFRKVLSRYTTTYDEIRQSPLARQVFTAKPFIKTHSNQLFCINCFLSILLNEHAVLWIVRDYYYQNGNDNFPSFFGALFEIYFEDLLNTCVEKTNFERVPESQNERADWKLDLDGYLMLVEQKSSLLGLAAKQQETDINKMKEFVGRNIVKGLQQLKQTEEDLSLGKCIKIVLLYESHLKFDLFEWIMPNAGIVNDDYYWLVTIKEMEMLLYQYKNNQVVFKEVVAEKIKRQTKNSNDGHSLEQLFWEKDIIENQHLLQEKFAYYDELAQREVEKRLESH